VVTTHFAAVATTIRLRLDCRHDCRAPRLGVECSQIEPP